MARHIQMFFRFSLILEIMKIWNQIKSKRKQHRINLFNKKALQYNAYRPRRK